MNGKDDFPGDLRRRRGKTVVGNWKMHGSRAALGELDAIAEAARGAGIDVAICLPATLIMAAATHADALVIGAQDCHPGADGSHTGDLSAALIADAGASLTILGHSERRRDHGETDTMVRAKAGAAFDRGLGVIMCVGETEAQRRAGDPATIVCDQLAASLPGQLPIDRLMVAYEPIWAIGAGRSASCDEIAAMHRAIRAALADRVAGGGDVAVLYGGSVTGGNADAILALDEVDGVLVGGASLSAAHIVPIIAAAARRRG